MEKLIAKDINFSFYLVASFFSLEEHGRKFADVVMSRTFPRSSFPLRVLLQFPEVRATGLRGLVSREISQATSSLLSRFSKDSKPDSILDPRFSRESRIEDRASILVSQKTVNLHLGGTVYRKTHAKFLENQTDRRTKAQ